MKILIISPCFPPVNTPDQHRVRISLPVMQNQGHELLVVSVLPEFIEADLDPVLKKHFRFERIIRLKAFRPELTRKIGLGNLGYRSLWQYHRAVKRILKKELFDLVYFSTTAFPVMVLGSFWKKRFRIPFVIDMQDPWRNDYYLTKPRNERPPKYFIAHRMNSILERRTMKHVDGIISVSDSYPEMIKERYHRAIPSSVIPFSASESDFSMVKNINLQNKIYTREKGLRYIVYTGAVTPGMPVPLEVLMKAFKYYIESSGDTALKLIFIGTTYEKGKDSKNRAIPIGEKVGIDQYMSEYPVRVGYFDALKVLVDADLIIFPGSLDSGYTASKIFPYILSQKPVFCLSHEKSSVANILKGCETGPVITFSSEADLMNKQDRINTELSDFMQNLPGSTHINREFFKQFSEQTMVQKQLDFFEQVIKQK